MWSLLILDNTSYSGGNMWRDNLSILHYLPLLRLHVHRIIDQSFHCDSEVPANMLSRRDKLLVQPWEDRRFKDHRQKVKLALPAIDDRPPPPRPHVAMKLKKCQRELDRKAKIQSDNFSLLQRLSAIMRVNRLDNHWTKPLPNFQHKVGLYYDTGSLNSRLSRSMTDSTEDIYSNVKCYACDYKKKRYEFKTTNGSLPTAR